VPVTVTCSFRMWQPTRIRRLQGLSDAQAVAFLVQYGVLSEDEGNQFCFD